MNKIKTIKISAIILFLIAGTSCNRDLRTEDEHAVDVDKLILTELIISSEISNVIEGWPTHQRVSGARSGVVYEESLEYDCPSATPEDLFELKSVLASRIESKWRNRYRSITGEEIAKIKVKSVKVNVSSKILTITIQYKL